MDQRDETEEPLAPTESEGDPDGPNAEGRSEEGPQEGGEGEEGVEEGTEQAPTEESPRPTVRAWAASADWRDVPAPTILKALRDQLCEQRWAVAACEDERVLEAVVGEFERGCACFELVPPDSNGWRGRTIDLREALAATFPETEGAHLLVLRDGSGATFSAMGRWPDGPPVEAFSALQRQVLLLVRESSLPEDFVGWRHAVRSIDREIGELETHLGRGQSQVAALSELLSDLFTVDGMQELAAKMSRFDSGGLSFSSGPKMVALELADAVGRQLPDPTEVLGLIQERRPLQTERIQRCRAAMSLTDEWTRDRLRGLRAQKASAKRPAVACDPVVIDAVEAMIAWRLPPELRPRLQWQRAVGNWGETESEVVSELREVIERNELASQVEQRGDPGGQADKRAEPSDRDATEMDLVVLFVAAFLGPLDPEEFDRVVRGLLRLGPNGDGERSPESAWAADADAILSRWKLEIREVRVGKGPGLRVVWKEAAHGRAWRRLLRQTRHFFVSRQVDHLQDTRFYSIGSDAEDRAFTRILELELEHARFAPARHGPPWVEALVEGVKRVASHTRPSAWGATRWPAELNRVQRVMRELQQSEVLRPFVRKFIDSLLRTPRACEWAPRCVVQLSGSVDFDEMKLLALCARSQDRQRVVPNVRREVARLCLSEASEPRIRAWDSVERWLSDTEGPALRSLATGAILDLLDRSAGRSTPKTGILAPLHDWLANACGDVPAPVQWLLDPRVRAGIEEAPPAGWLARALLPRSTRVRGRDVSRLLRAEPSPFRDVVASVLVRWMVYLRGAGRGDAGVAEWARASTPDLRASLSTWLATATAALIEDWAQELRQPEPVVPAEAQARMALQAFQDETIFATTRLGEILAAAEAP